VRSLHYKALTSLDQFYFNNVLNFQTLFSKDALNKLQDSKEKHAFWQTISYLNAMTDAIDERKLLLSDKVQSSTTHGIYFTLEL